MDLSNNFLPVIGKYKLNNYYRHLPTMGERFIGIIGKPFHTIGLFLASRGNIRKPLISYIFSEYRKRLVALNGLNLGHVGNYHKS